MPGPGRGLSGVTGITDMAPYRITRSGLDLIKRLEGFRDRPVRLDNGRWMIGYGHVFSARPKLALTRKEAELLLLYDLSAVGEALEALIFTPLSQNQTDALFSFVYNIGLEAFAESDVLSLINQGALVPAASAMEQWCRADLRGHSIVIDGLVRRRAAEKALFLTPRGGWRPAPSHILVPLAQAPFAQESMPLGLDMDASMHRLGSPFEAQANKQIDGAIGLQSDEFPSVEGVLSARSERADKARHSASPMIMFGVAIASLGLIAAGAYQGLALPLPPDAGLSQSVVAWLCGLGGVLALAFLTKVLVAKIISKS